MTIVAYRDGVMAADSRLTDGSLIMPNGIRKIFQRADGALVGVTGDAEDVEAARAWTERSGKKPPVLTKGAVMILVTSGGGISEYSQQGRFRYHNTTGYMAIGTGATAALGAMWAGASAVEAVAAAIALDNCCGGDVYVLEHL